MLELDNEECKFISWIMIDEMIDDWWKPDTRCDSWWMKYTDEKQSKQACTTKIK